MPHILVVSFPGQGHINPALQFAKRLTKFGAHVTFVTSLSALRRMKTSDKSAEEERLSFASFSDGYDDDSSKFGIGMDAFMSQLTICGQKTLRNLITDITINQGRPITHVVYSLLLHWVGELAREFRIPSTLLWNQPAALFNIYYHYFHHHEEFIGNNLDENESSLIKLPGLPSLSSRDLPSFLQHSNIHDFAIPLIKGHFDVLSDEKKNPKVLVNTVDELEAETLKAMEENFTIVGVGPLIPSGFLDGKDPSDTSTGGDLFIKSKDYTDYLSSKPSNSVVYVSFGSLSVLGKPQMEEISQALMNAGVPFLWVIRETVGEGKETEELSNREELEKQGMIVPWCSQVEVLSNPSIGCFVTHCGWNSTFESLSCGVPMVGFPQWTDQPSNAKLVQDVWKTGVRLRERDDGTVEADEIKRCLEYVMGSDEIRKNAKKWKDLARIAAMEGGSSHKNLKEFVEEIALH